tara:strand:+ start:2018 stop:2227 length:210 start_codon:yes stop_codon:yes gene_type:complete
VETGKQWKGHSKGTVMDGNAVHDLVEAFHRPGGNAIAIVKEQVERGRSSVRDEVRPTVSIHVYNDTLGG